MKNLLRGLITGALLGAISLTGFASNCSFLSNSAMSFFTKEDIHLFKVAQKDALEHGKDGTKIAWNNSQTGSHGYFVPTHTTHHHGVSCRDIKMFNSANLINAKATYKFCKLHDEWKIV